jgi:hypothetical protein
MEGCPQCSSSGHTGWEFSSTGMEKTTPTPRKAGAVKAAVEAAVGEDSRRGRCQFFQALGARGATSPQKEGVI